MDVTITFPYGRGQRTVRLPEENLGWVAGPLDVPAAPDVKATVLAALRAPVGSPGLPELVKHHGKKTVILVDDGTRATPQKVVLPVLLDELNRAGVPDDQVTIIVGLGTHRPMPPEEQRERFGEEVMRRVRVENLAQGPGDFADLGTTAMGIPVQVSRMLLESELSIAVGSIIPHMYAGWSGGAKMVQPAASSALTTARTHLMAGPRVYQILGQVDNPVRREMEEVAARAGLKFILNFVLTPGGAVVAAVAGDVVQAHRAGVALAEPIYTVEVDRPADIVIGGAHPADRDLWQGYKPVNNCGMLVRDGGTLILFIAAPEGISQDHPELMELGLKTGEEVMEMVREGRVADEVAAATHIAFYQTRRRIRVVLVTEGITPADGARIGLTATPDGQAALAEALERHGPRARIGVVTHGADIAGRVREAHIQEAASRQPTM
jgi:nickel-dependent lactate racemase